MNDTFTVKAWWAWCSKQAGSPDEYDVLRCTGGARRRATFSDHITDVGLGNRSYRDWPVLAESLQTGSVIR